MALDGKGAVYVTSNDGKITRVDLKDGTKTVVASKLSGPEGIDVAPDGRLIVAEVGAKRVSAVDPQTGAVSVGRKGPGDRACRRRRAKRRRS